VGFVGGSTKTSRVPNSIAHPTLNLFFALLNSATNYFTQSFFLKSSVVVSALATNEDTNGYDLRFHSSETTNASERQQLVVEWTLPSRTVYYLKDHPG